MRLKLRGNATTPDTTNGTEPTGAINRFAAAETRKLPGTAEPSYRATFRRHRVLFTLPVVRAVLIAAFIEFSAAKSYLSTASLWVDSPASVDSSLGSTDPAIVPPAQAEQSIITELLATREFVLAVGHNSLLGSYLAAHKAGGLLPSSGGGSVDDEIVAALTPTAVTATVAGPQVLQLGYKGPTPAVAASTLSALMAQLQRDSARFTKQHSEGSGACRRTKHPSPTRLHRGTSAFRCVMESRTRKRGQLCCSQTNATAHDTSSRLPVHGFERPPSERASSGREDGPRDQATSRACPDGYQAQRSRLHQKLDRPSQRLRCTGYGRLASTVSRNLPPLP